MVIRTPTPNPAGTNTSKPESWQYPYRTHKETQKASKPTHENVVTQFVRGPWYDDPKTHPQEKFGSMKAHRHYRAPHGPSRNPLKPEKKLMGGYKWGYKSPNMGYNYGYPTYNPTYNHP